MAAEIELFESPDLTALHFQLLNFFLFIFYLFTCFYLDFCLCGWIKSEFYKRKVDTPAELLAGILDAVGCINKLEDKLGQTRRDFHTRFAECTEVDGGVLEHLL
jgi:hypothetical protein